MEIHDLEQSLRDNTLCEIENIKIKKIDGELVIFIDEFRINETDVEGTYDVSDTKESFEPFETSAENIVKFFEGFYDGCSGGLEDAGDDEYYTLGFDFGTDAFNESDDESEDND